MFRRGMTLIVALVLLVGITAAGFLLPVPYLVASPGLALNTIGTADGEQVIQIDGKKSYEHKGGLSMVTVQYIGGPDHRMDMFSVVSAWLSSDQAVLPEEAVYPPDQSPKEISKTQTLEMDDSQMEATAAALNQMDIDYDTKAAVARVEKDAPAKGKLRKGDVITKVDGKAVQDKDAAASRMADRDPGDPVDVTIDRDGKSTQAKLTTEKGDDGKAVVGIMVTNDMKFPFDVDISVGDIGGPSAGLMFSLGIVDRLSADGLTGGQSVAGTGTITPDGTVGGVSGVAQKMVSAEQQGSKYFLVPEESCADTFDSAAADDITAVRIRTLDDAVDALKAIRTGKGARDLPRCEPK